MDDQNKFVVDNGIGPDGPALPQSNDAAGNTAIWLRQAHDRMTSDSNKEAVATLPEHAKVIPDGQEMDTKKEAVSLPPSSSPLFYKEAVASHLSPSGSSAPEPVNPSSDVTLPLHSGMPGAEKRRCGLKRRSFLLLVGLVVLLVVGAVVGGVVGGVLASQNASGNSDDTASTPAPSASVSSTNSIAASTAQVHDMTSSNFQVFRQDSSTGEIRYCLVWGDQPCSAEQTLALSEVPLTDTPLAVAATLSGDNNGTANVYLFYLREPGSKGNVQIAGAFLTCSSSSQSCEITANEKMGAEWEVDYDSQLAVALMPDGEGGGALRVFYQKTQDYVWVLQGDTASGLADGWTAVQVGGQAIGGSPLAVTTVKGSNMLQSVFVGYQNTMVQMNRYKDGEAGENSETLADVNGTPDSLTSHDRLTVCYTPSDSYTRMFLARPDTQEMSEYDMSASGQEEWFRRDTPPTDGGSGWRNPLGAIAAVAWDDQVRLIYEVSDESGDAASRLVVSSMISGGAETAWGPIWDLVQE